METEKCCGGDLEMVPVEGTDGRDVAAPPPPPTRKIGLYVKLILSCMVAGGVQYGWALQLSLLTPYVQTLGLSHALSSIIWLCGPIAGFLVQPCVGVWSDKCTSRLGKRRPFILTGCILICIAVTVIAFSSDIGFALGDAKKQHCSVYRGPRWHAAIVYVLGFWVLDFSNNGVQGPARALMADLSVGNLGTSAANAIFCTWMAIGNILGYLSGSINDWHKWLPFLNTAACCEACANLKGAFLVAVIFLAFCLSVTLFFAKEAPFCSDNDGMPGKQAAEEDKETARVARGMPRGWLERIRMLPPGTVAVFLVTGLTWLSWFPFILYNTDWMGREIFHGDPQGNDLQIDAFNRGVRAGAFGLLLQSVVLLVASLLVEPMCRRFTAKLVWAGSNFIVAAVMAATAVVSVWSIKSFRGTAAGHQPQQFTTADSHIKAAALALFTVLGLPLAVLYSVPFAVIAQLAANEGRGQGVFTGILNIFIVVPQVIVSLTAGPWDTLFRVGGEKGGNVPAFALSSGVALTCGIVGIIWLPKVSRRDFMTNRTIGGGH